MGIIRTGAKNIGSHLKKFGSASWNLTKKVGSGVAKAARAVDDVDDKYFGGFGKQALLAGAKTLAEATVKTINPNISDEDIKKYTEPIAGATSNYLSKRTLRRGYNSAIPRLGGLKQPTTIKYNDAWKNPYSNDTHLNISHW